MSEDWRKHVDALRRWEVDGSNAQAHWNLLLPEIERLTRERDEALEKVATLETLNGTPGMATRALAAEAEVADLTRERDEAKAEIDRLVGLMGDRTMREHLHDKKVLKARVQRLTEALAPFANFFQSPEHDLSPAKDDTPVAVFQDQRSGVPFASVHVGDFRAAFATLKTTEPKS